jgi:prophage regulatory protein
MSKVIRMEKVIEKTGLSRSTIYLKMDKQEFPQPFPLGPNSIGWYEDEIDGWISGRKTMKRNLRKGVVKGVDTLPLFKAQSKRAHEW